MNDLIVKDNEIKYIIYEIRGKQVMLDSEVAITKCHGYIYVKIITHFDIGKPISMLINFAKLGMSQKI